MKLINSYLGSAQLTRLRPWQLLAVALTSLPTVLAQNLTDAQVANISARLVDSALLSWELGTRTETILEYNVTTYSVFSRNSLPPPAVAPENSTDALAPFFQIARNTVNGRRASNNNTTGPQPLIKDGSAADPASLGMAVLMASWMRQDENVVDYAGAASDQLNYLFEEVPKTADGAISHRVSEVQLWSDFVYMVPPFLAYYGMLSRNRTLLLEGYNQIKLYRSYLRDPAANNLWKHVLLGSSGIDEGHWSTGNGWAAAGMLRVLATIQHSEYANTMKNEQKDLANWVKEIHVAMYSNLDSTNIFTNYADRPITSQGNFYDASSTALLASTVYRVSLLWNDHSHLPVAERTRKALSAANTNASSDSALQHFTVEGWLTPVVNPHSYGQKGNLSAEGQAFVVQMQAAWRDWVADGSKGANAGVRVAGVVGWVWVVAAAAVGGLLAV